MTDPSAASPRHENTSKPLSSKTPPAPIPLSILTGFLGSGKTTLLNRLLKDPAMAGTAVIINEFGDVGLDHLLVERIDDNTVLLQSGCLCCTLRGDLITALEKLLRDRDNGRARFDRVMLETTGLADPVPVLQTLIAHPYLVMRYRLDGIITTVDALNGSVTLDAHAESVRQVAVADRIVLTKTDMDVPADEIAALRERLRRLNPAAPILDAAAGDASPAALLDCGLYDPARKIPDVARWLAAEAYDASQDEDRGHHGHAHHHDVNRHDASIRSISLTADRPMTMATLEMFLDLLRSVHGPHLLRLKGIVAMAEHPDQPLVLHGVQHIFHPPVRLAAWPDADRRTKLVLIMRDGDPRTVRDLFNAFLGIPRPDQPDVQALTDNPLVPFGSRMG
jgi:G3E family GTPase